MLRRDAERLTFFFRFFRCWARKSSSRRQYYKMLMEGLATTGQFAAGFVLLARVEAIGLLLHSDESCYPMFRTLLEACRVVGDVSGASRVKAMMELLGFIARAPVPSHARLGTAWSRRKVRHQDCYKQIDYV